VARDSDQWRAVGNTVMELRFHKRLVIFRLAELLSASHEER
jgi:hypothetical protein